MGFIAFTADYDYDGKTRLYVASTDGLTRSLTEHLGDDIHVSRFEVSPTGPHVAFLAEGVAAPGLYVVGGAIVDPRRASDAADDPVEEMEWSPDGSMIAYRAGDPGQLYVVNADGTGRRHLTGPVTGGLRWSPDGSRIAYRSEKLVAK
ncbi:MAG: TolB family protein, partial [Planctomycetota bacterium]